MASSALRYILLVERDIPKAIEFYRRGLGATVRVATTSWAEIRAGNTTIALKQHCNREDDRSNERDGGSHTLIDVSPMLVFNVDDVQTRLTRMLEMGAHMDGGIQYTLQGSKIAVVRSPSGYLFGMVGE